jgi:hypothetical protein
MGWILVVIILCVMLISYLTTDICSYLVVFLCNVMGVHYAVLEGSTGSLLHHSLSLGCSGERK